MSRKILGLDIGPDALAAVLVRSSLKKVTLDDFVRIAIPAGGRNGIQTALAQLAETMDLTDAICVTAFPVEKISFRNLRVPFRDARKIRQILPFELEPTLPTGVDDLVIDFLPIGPINGGSQYGILAAALEKTQLEPYLALLKAAHLDPEAVVPGGYATTRCIARLPDTPSNWLLADLQSGHAALYVALEGKIGLIRSFPWHPDAGKAAIKGLCSQIQRTLAVLDEQYDADVQPERLFLAGTAVSAAGVDTEMERLLGFRVQKTDLQDALNPGEDRRATDRPWKPKEMDHALALALLGSRGANGLNFRRGTFGGQRIWAEHKKTVLRTGALAMLVLVLFFCNLFLDSFAMQKRLALLDRHTTEIFKRTLPDVGVSHDPVQQMRLKIEELKANTLLGGSYGKSVDCIDMLNEISKRIPPSVDVKLTRVVIGIDSVVISGDTDTFNAVDEIKMRLQEIEFFEKVDINSANMDKSGDKNNTGQRVRFKLRVEL